LSAALRALSNAFSEKATASLKVSSTPVQTVSTPSEILSRKVWGTFFVWRRISLVCCSSGMTKAVVMAASGSKALMNFMFVLVEDMEERRECDGEGQLVF
jgi:hypothetical protein